MVRLSFATMIAFVCSSVFNGNSMAQTSDQAATKARLDQIATSYTPKNTFMGTVLVVDGDDVVLDKAYGMASLEWQVPNTTDAKFRIGSITKQFTATLVLLLQQDGKLNVNGPVSKYLPNTPAAWARIAAGKKQILRLPPPSALPQRAQITLRGPRQSAWGPVYSG